jgi:hypothetical protein
MNEKSWGYSGKSPLLMQLAILKEIKVTSLLLSDGRGQLPDNIARYILDIGFPGKDKTENRVGRFGSRFSVSDATVQTIRLTTLFAFPSTLRSARDISKCPSKFRSTLSYRTNTSSFCSLTRTAPTLIKRVENE